MPSVNKCCQPAARCALESAFSFTGSVPNATLPVPFPSISLSEPVLGIKGDFNEQLTVNITLISVPDKFNNQIGRYSLQPAPASPSSVTTGVAIEIEGKEVFRPSGLPVNFEIVNNSRKIMYLTTGCSAQPTPIKLVHMDALKLKTSIAETVLPIIAIYPGMRQSCTWDQKVWFDDAATDQKIKYSTYVANQLVNLGHYQVGVSYFASKEDAQNGTGGQNVNSAIFSILPILR
jgi:hypothetical protein